MSTPRSVELPPGARPVTLATERGTFAALDMQPAAADQRLRPALLIPGYTGSKEDFLAVLTPLAAGGRRVVAIDMRGQHQTPGPADSGAYELAELAADIRAVAAVVAGGPDAAGVHLVGHSFGGLVARQAVLAGTAPITSLTLMSSGPGRLTGPAADLLHGLLAALGPLSGQRLREEVRQLWQDELEPQARAEGTPPQVIAFLRLRMLASAPEGLIAMARQLLACPDLTTELAGSAGLPVLVLYGEHDDKWTPQAQEQMAERLGAARICIPGAAHSPAVEAPGLTAAAVAAFWDAADQLTRSIPSHG